MENPNEMQYWKDVKSAISILQETLEFWENRWLKKRKVD